MNRHTQESCRLRWEALKALGYVAWHELDAIDHDTPWSVKEPEWWLEMMTEQRRLRAVA